MRLVVVGGGLVEAPATGVDALGVDALGVGALLPFRALSFWPPRRKFEDTAFAPSAAVDDVGAMEA